MINLCSVMTEVLSCCITLLLYECDVAENGDCSIIRRHKALTYDQYAEFAQVYDLFMDNIDYEQWVVRLQELLEQQDIPNGIVCELGCGTGSMTELLAEAGYDMIGIDASPEMLEMATEKKLNSGHDILYLLQDARSFELYGTVRAVISVCDSLNYVTEPGELLQVFRLVNNYLDPGGIFLFDMNTPVRYASIGDDTIAENRDEGSFIWENQYDPESQINEYLLTLFLPVISADADRDSGSCTEADRDFGSYTEADYDSGSYTEERSEGALYRKTEEYHCQRAYSTEEVKNLLQASGMRFLGAWDGYTRNPVSANTERVLYMAQEQGKEK